MKHALAIGRRGQGQVWPNPSVGCVIVNQGRIVGRGCTQSGGRPHAEVVALAMAGSAALNATAYVTLEPCSHQGKSGPCSDAIIAAGIQRVFVAAMDPDPRVNGQGVQKLRNAGIEVIEAVCEAEANFDHRGFFSKVRNRRPWVTLKLASSLDGRIATRTGDSQWITGPQARRHVHLQRSINDAVLVGAGTVRADRPSLTVRGLGDVARPVRIAVSSDPVIDLSSLLESDGGGPVWLAHGPVDGMKVQKVANQPGVKTLGLGMRANGVDLSELLEKLAEEGLTRLYCEGGGQLAAGLLQLGLVDEVHHYQAGLIIGAEGLPMVGPAPWDHLADVPRWRRQKSVQLGNDQLSVWLKQA